MNLEVSNSPLTPRDGGPVANHLPGYNDHAHDLYRSHRSDAKVLRDPSPCLFHRMKLAQRRLRAESNLGFYLYGDHVHGTCWVAFVVFRRPFFIVKLGLRGIADASTTKPNTMPGSRQLRCRVGAGGMANLPSLRLAISTATDASGFVISCLGGSDVQHCGICECYISRQVGPKILPT